MCCFIVVNLLCLCDCFKLVIFLGGVCLYVDAVLFAPVLLWLLVWFVDLVVVLFDDWLGGSD